MDNPKDPNSAIDITPKKTSSLTHPHRCAKHLEDLLISITNLEVQDQFGIAWKCMWSEKGQEPPRHLPSKSK